MEHGNEVLHWNGDQILFSTTQTGANGTWIADDIKIGMDGDITPQDPKYQGLTFYDRGPDGYVMGCHNATGANYVGIGSGNYTYHIGGSSVGSSPCTLPGNQLPATTGKMPASIQWGSQFGNGTPGGTIMGVPRPDGYAYGWGTLQGVRTYDGAAGTWTTPDAYAGDVDDPASQKSYMWSGNNPVSYSDPSGYFTLCTSCAQGGVINAYSSGGGSSITPSVGYMLDAPEQVATANALEEVTERWPRLVGQAEM
jgi:RHS repeat-associated protein